MAIQLEDHSALRRVCRFSQQNTQRKQCAHEQKEVANPQQEKNLERIKADWGIDVAVKNGIVTLTGTVDSDSKKKLAEEAAWRATNVGQVENNIEVNKDVTFL